MTPKPLPSIITVIDIGTHKTTSLAGQVVNGQARMIGFSERPTDGVVKGMVTELEKLQLCVHEVVNDVERTMGRAVDEVYLSLSGPDAEGERVHGYTSVPAHDGKITNKDLKEAIENAKCKEPPSGCVSILYMRQPTMVDGKPVGNPVGMTGQKIEVNFWRVTMKHTGLAMRVGMINSMGIKVHDFVLASHAAACAVVTDTDKKGGVLVIDVGAGTTNWILYFKEHILCAGAISVGGEHITNDLSIALRISRETAEDLKVRFGSGVHRDTDANQTIWKDGDRGVGDQQFNRGTITQVTALRFQETLNFVKRDVMTRVGEIFKNPTPELNQNFIPSGVIITGGTANLHDATEGVEKVFGLSARVGTPKFENESFRKPQYAGVVGLMTAAIADAPAPKRAPKGFLPWLKSLFRF